MSVCLYSMDPEIEVVNTWRDIVFDAWTAASIGDVQHLEHIANSRIEIKDYNSSIRNQECVGLRTDKKVVNFDVKNKGGWTCLMYAGYYDHAQVARWLLEGNLFGEYRGPSPRLPANPAIKNRRQRTALMLAASCGHNETVETILDTCKGKAFQNSLSEDYLLDNMIAIPYLYR